MKSFTQTLRSWIFCCVNKELTKTDRQRATADVNDRYYPRYHLAPPYGWMNDPNGFSEYRNEYHLFYQFNPNSSLVPGIAHWGHAKSKDLFRWEHLPIAMYPDQWYDKGGVFSGSAIVENDKLYLYYTGNVNNPDQYPDHQQHQVLAISTNGINVTKQVINPIINGTEYQPDFRDPKVWKYGKTYYMVLGNSFHDNETNSTLGRALLYTSKDKTQWNFASILDESDGSLGYMWECPDFFELDGRFVLLFSPQGIQPSGYKYRNLYQTGYIVGNFDYKTNMFTPITEFVELDHGHDFYATQTILDKAKRRILIAWMDMWDQNYVEAEDGFTGQMTLPRVLSLDKNNRLIQRPVKEIASLRGRTRFSGRARAGAVIRLRDKAAEIHIKSSPNNDLDILIESSNASNSVLISYNYQKGLVTLNRGGKDGVRRTKWRPESDKLHLKAYIDASSIELFFGNGEVTFSSRFFPTGAVKVRIGGSNDVESITVFDLQRTIDASYEIESED
ncbi:sucrose-6-phosphate hydrolase isoform X2 [Papilio machaon]|uniref:sucrose-6-phosphate hydrolase isoform X2 n=1 Tax=Papilio machaon TaxID=76193 RepID=UPI001E66350A|nr:sucrose-6-phosphate hydrolase isoform X2 [Papilio machaon]